MSGRTAQIAAELERIRQTSPEDIAVLMVPVIKALSPEDEEVPDRVDASQLAAMVNSLAQVAAQSGDPDTAIAIASIQAEIETLSDAELPSKSAQGAHGAHTAPPGVTKAGAPAPGPADDTGAKPSAGQPFRHPLLQVAGGVSFAALSYSAYVAIESLLRPGSVASWTLTVSTTLLAVAAGLRWRRYVIGSRASAQVRVITAALALGAGFITTSAALYFGPALRIPVAMPSPDTSRTTPTLTTAPGAAPPITDSGPEGAPLPAAPGAAPGSGPEDRIAIWWMGDANPVFARTAPGRSLAQLKDETTPDEAGADPGEAPQIAPAAPRDEQNGEPAPAGPLPPLPLSRDQRFRRMLNEDVVLIDAKGLEHRGKLTGVSKDGVTLRTEVRMFGEPILAHRLYLFNNIEVLRPQ